MGYVYLIVEIDKYGDEVHKIGVTKNDPSKRNKGLQTGNSDEIRVIATYESLNYKKIEKWFHNRYRNYKTLSNNEWFSLPEEEILGFLDNCKKADGNISFLKENNPFCK